MKRQRAGDLEGALNAFRQGLQIRSFMLHSVSDPNKLRSEELHSAMFLIQEAVEISECTGAQSIATVAMLKGLLGMLCHLRGDIEHAIDAYLQALRSLEQLGEEHCLSRAILLHCLGDARSELESYRTALAAYMEAHQVRLVKRTLQTDQGALLLMSIGLARVAVKDLANAMEAYTLAALVFESIGKIETNAFAVLLTYIGAVKLRMSHLEDAASSLLQARHIRMKLGSLGSAEGKHLLVILQQLQQQLQQQMQQHQGEESVRALPSPRRSPRGDACM